MNEATSIDKRFDNLDLMKAYAILAVITLHIPLWATDFIDKFSFIHVIQYAFRLISEGVPIFVTINGFLLLRKRNLDLKKHCKKMLKMLAILVLWGVILGIVGLSMYGGG